MFDLGEFWSLDADKPSAVYHLYRPQKLQYIYIYFFWMEYESDQLKLSAQTQVQCVQYCVSCISETSVSLGAQTWAQKQPHGWETTHPVQRKRPQTSPAICSKKCIWSCPIRAQIKRSSVHFCGLLSRPWCRGAHYWCTHGSIQNGSIASEYFNLSNLVE